MIHLPTPPSSTCPYCGGFPTATSYGSACSSCGSVLESIRFLQDGLEEISIKHGIVSYRRDLTEGTTIGHRNECVSKWWRLRALDYINYSRIRLNDELRTYKSFFHLTTTEFHAWKYRIHHYSIPRFAKYNYWAGFLYQIIYSRMSLRAICDLFTKKGHRVNTSKIISYFSRDNLKLPQVDYCKRFVMRLREQYPTLDLTHINSYIIPAIPRMTSKFRAAISLALFLEARHQWSFYRTATLLGISSSQLYAEKHRWEVWEEGQ